MQDGAETSQPPVADYQPLPPPLVMPPRRRAVGPILAVALVAFALGGGLAGWIVWRGDLDRVLPQSSADRASASDDTTPRLAMPQSGTAPDGISPQNLGGVETRLALLEDRFSRIDQQANAAAANASRAEALLVALAARRSIEKGEPLGYLEYQLKLRFGGAQPQAVKTIVDTAKRPVTLYSLSSELEAEAPLLSGERRNESTWTKVQRELSSLFVVRRTTSPTLRQLDRADRAQILLKAGKIDEAIAEVERLPGAQDARDWIASARRFAEAQRALEVIETSAMFQQRDLRDGQGLAVNQPSPLLPPADKAAAEPAAN